jgi:DNA-binding GntR family transcriptional regulator
VSLYLAVGGKDSHREPDADDMPERNYDEERLRHASRLVKAVHAHDVEGADDAMRAHYSVMSDEHEALTKKEK